MFIEKVHANYMILAKYVEEAEGIFPYGWLSPDGKRYRCGYENHVFAARELLDSFYPDWKKSSLRVVDSLLDMGWTRVTKDHQNTYILQSNRMNDSIIEFLSDLKVTQPCTVDLNNKIYNDTARGILDVTASIKKLNTFRKRGKKKVKPRASEAVDTTFSSVTNIKKLAPLFTSELKLADPFNFNREHWVAFTKKIAPKLLTAIFLDLEIVPNDKKVEFLRYIEKRLRTFAN